MKKRFDLFFLASLLFAACMTSCSDSTFPEPVGPGELPTEVAPFSVKLDLNRGDIKTRASQSSMKPVTRWKDIKHMMLLLHTEDGTIRWAKILNAQTFDTLQDNQPLELFYESAPVGALHFVAVANCDPNGGNVSQGLLVDSYTTIENPDYNPEDPNSPQYITETVREIQDYSFTEANLLSVNKNQLVISPKYTPGKFLPDFYREAVAKYIDDGSYPVRYGIQEPGNIFRGGDDHVTIEKDTENYIECELSRDVSLLRVRLNPSVLNSDGLIDFTQNSGIFIGNVPREMHIPSNGGGTDGTVTEPGYQPASDVSIRNAIMSIYNPNGTFYYQDPTEGYVFAEGNGPDSARIVTEEFPLWRDIILFPTSVVDPNNSLRAKNPYYLTISAKALKGHRLHDGSVMQEDGTVYWSAKITTVMKPNNIYEFNIQLYGGGTYPLPPDPDITPSPSIPGQGPTPPTVIDPSLPTYPEVPGVDPELPHGPNPPSTTDTIDGYDPDEEGERHIDPTDPDPTNPTPTVPTTPYPGVDPDTGYPLYPSRPTIKPVQPIDPGYIPDPTDPSVTVDPNTGWPVDPTDPDNKIIDPKTGVVYEKDPDTKWPVDPTDPDKVIDPDTGEVYDKDPVTKWPVDDDGDLVDPRPDSKKEDGTRPHVDPDPSTYPDPTDPTKRWPIDDNTGLPKDPDTGKLKYIDPDKDPDDPDKVQLIPDPTWPVDPTDPTKVINPKTNLPEPLNPDPDNPIWVTLNPHPDPTDPEGTKYIPYVPSPEPGKSIDPDDPYTWIVDPKTGEPIDPLIHHPIPTETLPAPGEPYERPTPTDPTDPTDPDPTIKIPGGSVVPPAVAPPSSITDPTLPTLHIHNINVYEWGATRETNVEL